MTILYVANDGTQFDSEQKCREYETSKIDEIIICKDVDGKRLDFNHHDLLEKSYYIICKTPTAIEIIQRRSAKDKISISEIDKPGAYFWNDKTGRWESITLRISYLTSVAKKANKEKAKLEKILKD